MMMKVDLNCDLGESFGNYKIGNDKAMMKYISSANIACGFHAGDPMIMEKTIKLALANNVAVGAHPGYPDLNGFGRRNMDLALDEVKAIVKYQVSALKGMTEALGGKLQHVKPHGALYNRAALNIDLSLAITKAVYEIDSKLILMGLANSEMQEAAKQIGLAFASEVFADRAYTNEGMLVSRSKEGAVIHDAEKCTHRVLDMVIHSNVMSEDGTRINIVADTICIHGDNPQAFNLAIGIHDSLIKNRVQISSLK